MTKAPPAQKETAAPAQKEVVEAKKQPQLPRMWGWMVASIILTAILWIIRTPTYLGHLIGIEFVGEGLDQVLTLWDVTVPGDIVVLVHKAATITLGAVGGMYFDRTAFPYGRPDRLVDPNQDGEWELAEAVVFTGACWRRMGMMVGFMTAFGLLL